MNATVQVDSHNLDSVFTFRGTTTLNNLFECTNIEHKDGEIWFTADTRECYAYCDHEWIKISEEEKRTGEPKEPKLIVYKCPSCGASLRPSDTKCSYCDSKLTWINDIPCIAPWS